MDEGTTIRCPICGEPYVFYSYYAGDQSACPECRRKAREKERKERDYLPSNIERRVWKGKNKGISYLSRMEN
jgi:endogenous inhibitor of DNA gyrase (YacG/DUF329 family)